MAYTLQNQVLHSFQLDEMYLFRTVVGECRDPGSSRTGLLGLLTFKAFIQRTLYFFNMTGVEVTSPVVDWRLFAVIGVH